MRPFISNTFSTKVNRNIRMISTGEPLLKKKKTVFSPFFLFFFYSAFLEVKLNQLCFIRAISMNYFYFFFVGTCVPFLLSRRNSSMVFNKS